MQTFLYIVFFLSCIILVISVLLQPGKTDAGALFTSGVSSAALNPRGTASVLSKLTIAAAAVFMLSALFLSLPAFTGDVSVLDTQSEKKSAAPANTNANVDANAANANTGNVNAAANTEAKPAEEKPAANTEAKPAADAESKEAAKPEAKADPKTEEKAPEKKDEK
ncbi:MAG: preprotein translocase subunit SecG [Pyrinomonadaceae bacterium]